MRAGLPASSNDNVTVPFRSWKRGMLRLQIIGWLVPLEMEVRPVMHAGLPASFNGNVIVHCRSWEYAVICIINFQVLPIVLSITLKIVIKK